VASELSLRGWRPAPVPHHTVLVPIGGMQKAVVQALRYARTLSRDVRAVYVDIDSAASEGLRQQWGEWGQDVELVVLESPYRSLMEPLLEYIEQVQAATPDGYVTVILPEFVPRRIWHHLLHNQHALLIKAALLFKPNVIVTSVPFHLGTPSTLARHPRIGSRSTARSGCTSATRDSARSSSVTPRSAPEGAPADQRRSDPRSPSGWCGV
jgi:hypothetical protein